MSTSKIRRLLPTGTAWHRSLESLAALGLVLVCGVFLWDRFSGGQPPPPPQPPPTTRTPPPVPTDPIDIRDAAALGSPAARAALLMFSDFECPFCQRFAADTLPAIVRDYVDRGTVRLAFMHLPLEQIHPRAMRAAEGAECARRQNRFWPFHDRLIAAPKALDDAALRDHALAVGLSADAFAACLAAGAEDKVRSEQRLARSLGITGTPAFIVGTVGPDGLVRATARLAGARPVSEFKVALDAVLAGEGTGTGKTGDSTRARGREGEQEGSVE